MKINRPNAQIHYQLDGPEGAPMIVFANSLGTDLSVWEAILPYFSNMRVVRFDKRGHGQSSAEGPFGMDDLVGDAIAVIEACGGRDVIFVGLSIGGLIGQGVCAQRPDLVRGFVLMDSAAKIGTPQFWQERIAAIEAHGIASMSDALMERWFTPEFIAAGHSKPWQQMVENTSLAGYLGCCQAISETDFTQEAAALSVPVLALVGDQDGATPPDLVKSTAQMIQGAQFEVIAGSGHIPCVEKPAETAQLITSFIGGLT